MTAYLVPQLLLVVVVVVITTAVGQVVMVVLGVVLQEILHLVEQVTPRQLAHHREQMVLVGIVVARIPVAAVVVAALLGLTEPLEVALMAETVALVLRHLLLVQQLLMLAAVEVGLL
jgi:hypothetical protein